VAELYSHRANTAFDAVAWRYDELWTCSTVGRLQRDAVWRRLDTLFQTGDELLDLGCGTGEDAIHLEALGAKVFAIDASPEMVRVARTRGANASVLSIEDLAHIKGHFDGVVSNFGALNCVGNLKAVSASLAKLVLPGRYLAVCVLGRFCLWETLWYLLTGHPRKAFRRLRAESVSRSLGVRVRHFSIRELQRTLSPHFTLVEWRGIGLSVPPSYVSAFPEWVLRVFGAIDRCVAHWPLFRALADHRLLVFVRSTERRPSRRAHPAWRNPFASDG
jgi:ubiquinone/menaquinone biosynthesis C-methylase UbiE